LVVVTAIFEVFVIAIFGITLMRNASDVVEKPGQLAADGKLGGPCLAIKEFEYAKHGPIGIGDCRVHYTNDSQTAAKVTLQFIRNNSWVIVAADAVTGSGPLASLDWHVIRNTETSPYTIYGVSLRLVGYLRETDPFCSA
jgi:hypothetical protein